MSKFQRTYTLTVQGRFGTTYTFNYPLTCVFEIQKRAASGINTGRFMLYNLSESTRSDLEFDMAVDIDVRRAFQFKAGYLSEAYQPVLFDGEVKQAFSYRDGTEVITEIVVNTGITAAQNAQIASATAAGWNAAAEARKIVATMQPHGVTLGAVGSLFNTIKSSRGVMWLGSSWDVLKKFARGVGGYACIDDSKVYLMALGDVLPTTVGYTQIDSTTGLIGTPRRSGATVTMQMIFEPRLRLMQQLPVKSQVNRYINGSFQVQALSHRGTISGAFDGGVVTAAELFQPPTPFVLVAPR